MVPIPQETHYLIDKNYYHFCIILKLTKYFSYNFIKMFTTTRDKQYFYSQLIGKDTKTKTSNTICQKSHSIRNLDEGAIILQRWSRSMRDQENLQRMMMFWVLKDQQKSDVYITCIQVMYKISTMSRALSLRCRHTNARQMPSLPSSDLYSNGRQGMPGSPQIPPVICG